MVTTSAPPASQPGVAGRPPASLEVAAGRLADLLTGGGGPVVDPEGGELLLDGDLVPRPLTRTAPPADVWAVDGGQVTVADARCLQLVVTRAARVRFVSGACVLEDEGEIRAALLGGGEGPIAIGGLGLDISPTTSCDLNLLRDRWEWDAARSCILDADEGALVLVDGDLQPDWRIPSSYVSSLVATAAERGVALAAVTKHSSLSRGGAPLLGQLEREAESTLGPRAMWWARLGRTRPDVAFGGFQVVAARLDPDARFAFRIDLPLGADPESALGALSGLCDDAAFPGYPYPLTVADRLAACPGWLRAELWLQLEELFDRAGVPFDVRERAFTDRHGLMERA